MKRKATRNFASGRLQRFLRILRETLFCVRQVQRFLRINFVECYAFLREAITQSSESSPVPLPLPLVKVLVATLLVRLSLMAMAFTVVVALRVKGSV